jgi:hypothetical protein
VEPDHRVRPSSPTCQLRKLWRLSAGCHRPPRRPYCSLSIRRPNALTAILGDAQQDYEPTAADLRQKRRETVDKLSAELGDWLLRCNGGEGMSQCVSNLFVPRTQ